MDKNEVRDTRDVSDVWDVRENRVVTSPGSTHMHTHTHINEYTVYSVSISLMSDIIFNTKSRHHVLVSF